MNKIGYVGCAGSAGVGFIIHPQLASYALSSQRVQNLLEPGNTYPMRVTIGLMLVEAGSLEIGDKVVE